MEKKFYINYQKREERINLSQDLPRETTIAEMVIILETIPAVVGIEIK